MAQQHSPQTRSNLTMTTSVSTLDPESSPKNDSSLVQRKRQRDLRIIDRLREIHGLKRRGEHHSYENALNYVCTSTGCIELH